MKRFLLSLIVVGCSVCLLTTSVDAKGKPANPGKSGDAPGQSGGSPGNSGNAPGQGGTNPGNSGNAPGQIPELMQEVVVAAPGKSGDVPGQVKNERGDYLEDFLSSKESLALTPSERSILLNSEEHEKIKTQIEMILVVYGAGLITKDEARTELAEPLLRMKRVTRPAKFLGFLHKCRGVNIFNGLGLLCR